MKFWGKVRRHNKRGKRLGFPTANINLHKVIPEGIYISKTKLENKIYSSVTFIGSTKTFNEKNIHAEVYILDFKKNIYGQWISVKLLKKIRNNRKFKIVDELIKQMKKDEEITRKYFSKREDQPPRYTHFDQLVGAIHLKTKKPTNFALDEDEIYLKN